MRPSTGVDSEVRDTLARIRRQEWREQCDTIRNLAEGTSASADVVLLHLLDHRSPLVREESLKALFRRSKALVRLAARAVLDDANSLVRNAAAEVLGAVGTRPDGSRLTRALRDADWVVRASAAASLGYVGGKSAHPALKEAMRRDPHPVVRRDAAFALSYAREQEVVPDLEQALAEETEEQARVGLLSALYVLGQRQRLPALLAFLRSGAPAVRRNVVNWVPQLVLSEDRGQAAQALDDLLLVEDNPGLRTDAGSARERLTPGSASDTPQ